MDIKTIINLNLAENSGGKLLLQEDYKLKKNVFLRKQYNGLVASVNYASKNLYRNSKQVKIRIVFSEKSEINAYVSRLRHPSNKHYLIVCYRGVFSNLQHLFLWLMSSERLLSTIGRKQNATETDFKNLSTLFIKEGKIDVRALSTPFVLLGPREMDSASKGLRNQYALLLTSLATEFLFFHEMTHIEYGHLDYLQDKLFSFGALHSNDTPKNQPAGNQNEMKGIEFEADLGAAEYLFDSYWNSAYKGTLMKSFSTLLKTNEHTMFAIAYSLLWLFHLVQDYRALLAGDVIQSHPTPACRILTVFRIFYVLGREKNGDTELIYNQFLSAAKEYLLACEEIEITGYITPQSFENDSPAMQELVAVEDSRLAVLERMKPYQLTRKT